MADPFCVFIFTCLSSCIVRPSWAKVSTGLVGYPPTFDDIWPARHSGTVTIGYCCSFDWDWWHSPRPHHRRFLVASQREWVRVTSTSLPINGLVHSSKIQWVSGGYRCQRKGTTSHIIHHELRLAHILSDVLWWCGSCQKRWNDKKSALSRLQRFEVAHCPVSYVMKVMGKIIRACLRT